MFSRKVAALAAFSLLLASSASIAQAEPDAPPAQTENRNPMGNQDAFTRTGLLLMLTVIAGAILTTVLATQIGGDKKPASP